MSVGDEVESVTFTRRHIHIKYSVAVEPFFYMTTVCWCLFKAQTFGFTASRVKSFDSATFLLAV